MKLSKEEYITLYNGVMLWTAIQALARVTDQDAAVIDNSLFVSCDNHMKKLTEQQIKSEAREYIEKSDENYQKYLDSLDM